MAVRTLWKFVVGRAKILIKNYNVVERAEKVMETNKRSPPRHPGTEAKFKVLIKGDPNIQTEVAKRDDQLLGRLKSVKVTSEDPIQGDRKETRPLPQSRDRSELPLFGFEEPKIIPDGKCSLKQALEFITNHENDPSTHSVASIANTYKMKSVDVEHIVKYFRAYQLYVGRDEKVGLTKATIQGLGATKVIHPLFKAKFSDKQKEVLVEDVKEDKK